MKNLLLLLFILCIGLNAFAQKDFTYKIEHVHSLNFIERSNGDFWVVSSKPTSFNSSTQVIQKLKGDGTLIEEKNLDFHSFAQKELSTDKVFFEEYNDQISVFSNDLVLKKRILKSPKILTFDVHENKIFALKKEDNELHLLTYNNNLDSINQQKTIPFTGNDRIVSTYFQGDSIRLLVERKNSNLESYVYNFKSEVLKKGFTCSIANLSFASYFYDNQENKYHLLSYHKGIFTLDKEGALNFIVNFDPPFLDVRSFGQFSYSLQKGYLFKYSGKTDITCGDYVSMYYQISANGEEIESCDNPISNLSYEKVAYSKSGKRLSLGRYMNPNDPKQYTNSSFFSVSSNDICKPIKATAANDFIQENNVKIYPNPFSENTTIEINGDYKNLIFNILDMNGKSIRSEKFDENRLIFQRNNLQTGLYIYEIISEGKQMQHGKIVVQ